MGCTEVVADGFDVSGFAQVHGAARVGNNDCTPGTECDFPFNEQRLRLKVEGQGFEGRASLEGKLDLVHDAALDDFDADLREFFGDYNADRYTVRGGRQVITWGVGDLLFINDTFPKDWVAFFGGLPLEFLKLGSDALRVTAYPAFADLELVVSRFREDELPASDRFILTGPFPPSLPRNVHDPSDPEVSARAARYVGNWDVALYFSRTHFRAPAFRVEPGSLTGRHPRLNTYGASASGPMFGGVLSGEAGYYDSREDDAGSDPSIENSQMRFLLGYSRQVAEDTTLGLQGYAEWMQDHDAYRRTLPSGFPARPELRTVATVRLTRQFMHQTLTFNTFAFLGLSEEDAYLIPSLRYAFSDALWAEAGANVFLGSSRGMFGSLNDNDNVYLTVRYSF